MTTMIPDRGTRTTMVIVPAPLAGGPLAAQPPPDHRGTRFTDVSNDGVDFAQPDCTNAIYLY